MLEKRDTHTQTHTHTITYLYPITSQHQLWYAYDWLTKKKCLLNSPSMHLTGASLKGGCRAEPWLTTGGLNALCPEGVCVEERERGVSLSDLGSGLNSRDLDVNRLTTQTFHIYESFTDTHTHGAVRAHDQLSVWTTYEKMFGNVSYDTSDCCTLI